MFICGRNVDVASLIVDEYFCLETWSRFGHLTGLELFVFFFKPQNSINNTAVLYVNTYFCCIFLLFTLICKG